MTYLENIQEILSEVIEYENKKMFGAHSFVKDTATFGFVKDEKFYFRVNDDTKEKYISASSEQFNPMKNKGMPYYTVPEKIQKDKSLLKEWAIEAFEVALTHKLSKKKK